MIEKKKRITAKQFWLATGRLPVEDDLKRVNCKKAGKALHWTCGWCYQCNAPVFECMHFLLT